MNANTEIANELMATVAELERLVQDENRLMTSGEILQLASDLGSMAMTLDKVTWAVRVAEMRQEALDKMQAIVDKLREADPDAFKKATGQ